MLSDQRQAFKGNIGNSEIFVDCNNNYKYKFLIQILFCIAKMEFVWYSGVVKNYIKESIYNNFWY